MPDVVKVERPPVGDILRKVGVGARGTSAYFVNTNWGKRSIALDFEQEGDRATLRRLVATADVLVENFRPTVMPRLGFAPDDLVREHPRLIYAALRGFPSDSPLADVPAYDHVIQAMTGFGSTQADLRTGVPVLVQQAVVDKVTGLTAAQAITAALFERHRTGRGQVIEIPMLKAGLSFLWPDVSTNITMQGEFDQLPAQSRTFRLSPTADGYVRDGDGHHTAVGRAAARRGPRRARRRPRLRHATERGRNAAALMKEIAATLATLPTDEVVARLTAEGVPLAGDDTRTAPRGDRGGHARVPGPGGAPAARRHGAPAPGGQLRRAGRSSTTSPTVGEHTAEILAELDGD